METYGVKRIGKLPKIKQFDLVMWLAEVMKRDVYLFYDVTRQMPLSGYIRFKSLMEKLSSRGSVVVFLTTEQLVTDPGSSNDYDFWELKRWQSMVDTCQSMNEKDK